MKAGEYRVEVALPLPLAQTFTYAVSGSPPPPGTRVLVPFRRDERIGWVVGPGTGEGLTRIRSILAVLEDVPSVSPEVLALSRWMADYYLAPLGMVLRGAIPSVLTDSSRDYLTLVDAGDGSGSSREERLLQALGEDGVPRRVRTLRKTLGMGSIWPEIRALTARGLMTHETVSPRDPPVRTHRVVRITQWLSSLADREERFGRAHRQRDAYEFLETSGGSVELAHLLEQGGFSRSVIAGLEEKSVVEVVAEEILRDPFKDRPQEPPKDLIPTSQQKKVLASLLASLKE